MSRIHPAEKKCQGPTREVVYPSVFTVWKKSSMTFQGTDGFTVFNGGGRLAFRVDNYSRKYRCLVLMDGAGKALLTLRPQILSMQYQWNGFNGDYGRTKSPRIPVFSMRRRSMLLRGNDEAEIFMGGPTNQAVTPDFRIDGSFRRRRCKIRGSTGEVVAEITRKKVNTTILLSEDVFSLNIHPGLDCELIMAFIVVMDRICLKPFAPVLCS
ncbi:hypothetical protein HHK36_018707 [Tetracentron sinense]|uniref:Protein LURP-one-related 5-like n=1 Tax=Tetracentron sinense TaxID=13715 RepID=A0A835DE98_TETSI|nr:hypothetical protein HHK36_018707 [Tetracentron sinense]